MSAADLDVLLEPADLTANLAKEVRSGLTVAPKQLPPKFFYDDRGSALFDEITRLEEYYPTRTERQLLTARADDIARAADAEVLLELGSGSSEKTALLLDAMGRTGRLAAYVPVDVSAGALRGALAQLAVDRPSLPVHAVVADFEHHLEELPRPGRRLVAFLGGTIGNFQPAERLAFLMSLAGALAPGESLLLGLDLVKEPSRLVAAYDDAAGVTAAFNRNVLHVLNRELGADFDPDAFAHVAVWDDANEWIEMRLRAQRAMSVHVPSLDLDIRLEAGEEIRTEISAKFRRDGVSAELRRAGLGLREWWTDPAGDYALALASPEAADLS
ncbi:MAG: L-histidine N(alpha)-methyltransferase [Actinomycetes bacterium]